MINLIDYFSHAHYANKRKANELEITMNIKAWFQSASDMERAKVAEAANTTVAYLQQLSGNHRQPSRSLASRLEDATRQITPDRVIDKVEAIFPTQSTAA